MTETEDISEKIGKKIEEVQKQVLMGKINLLDYELVPIFNELKKNITVSNLDINSRSYKVACSLLNQKFGELKKLLSSLDNEKKFLEYLKLKPDENEIANLFNGCWRKSFNLNVISLEFLEESKQKLSKEKKPGLKIETLLRKAVKGEKFLLEISESNFTDNMMDFLNIILGKLPCVFEEIFEDEKDQIKIYQKFVYVLHLLQLGKIKYQKETNTLYL